MDKKEKIILAAIEEFVEHGFAGARVRNISIKAGVNLAAISYYFGGKEELYKEVLRYIGEIPDHLDIATEQLPPEATPEDFLRHWLITFLKHSSSESRLFRLRYRMVVREMLSPSPYFSEMFVARMKPRFQQLGELIRRVRRVPTSDQELTMLFALMLAQCLFFFNKPISGNLTGDREYGATHAEALAERILAGIKI